MGNCGSNSNDSKGRYQLANPYEPVKPAKQVKEIIVKIVPQDSKESTTVQTYGDTVVIKTSGIERTLRESGVYDVVDSTWSTRYPESPIQQVHVLPKNTYTPIPGTLIVECNVLRHITIHIVRKRLVVNSKAIKR